MNEPVEVYKVDEFSKETKNYTEPSFKPVETKKEKYTLGIISISLVGAGILGFFFLPATLLIIAGFILSIVALAKKENKIMPIIALSLSSAVLLLFIFFFFIGMMSAMMLFSFL